LKKDVRIYHLFLVITLATPLLMNAQFPDILWIKVYGGSENDIAHSVQLSNDGGYVVVGGTASFGAGNGDIWLVKLDSLGDSLWTRTYGGPGNEVGNSIDITADGGYIIAGWTNPNMTGDYDLYLLHTDENGDVLWTNAYGGSSEDIGYSVKETNDDGYIAVGETRQFGTSDIFLLKVDSLGSPLWTKIHGGSHAEWGRCVQETYEGGFVVAGYTDGDALLLVTDANGDTIWTQTYGGPNTDHFFSVQQTNDSGYMAVGATVSFTGTDYDLYIVRTNKYGDTLWTKTYGSSADDDYGLSISASHNGFVITGFYAWSPMFYTSELYLLRIDNDGNELWAMTITYGSECHGESVQPTADGGYVVAGWTSPYPPYDCDFLILKTAQDTFHIQEIIDYGVNDIILKAWPNPFRGCTEISYVLCKAGLGLPHTLLQVYDATGQLVRNFHVPPSNEWGRISRGNRAQDNSCYRVSWDGRDDLNVILPSGVYFATLKAPYLALTEKLVLIR
jgi:hypothetical protein